MKKSPSLWQRAEADPRTLSTVAKKLTGALGEYNPDTETITVDPRALAGQKFDYPATPHQTVIHELLHFLNQPRVAAADPGHALETAQQIAALLKGRVPYQQVQDYVGKASNLAVKLEKLGVQLSAQEKSAVGSVAQRRALTEALSYLGEESLRTNDPQIKALAEALRLR
jgi:hypothetical protein